MSNLLNNSLFILNHPFRGRVSGVNGSFVTPSMINLIKKQHTEPNGPQTSLDEPIISLSPATHTENCLDRSRNCSNSHLLSENNPGTCESESKNSGNLSTKSDFQDKNPFELVNSLNKPDLTETMVDESLNVTEQ